MCFILTHERLKPFRDSLNVSWNPAPFCSSTSVFPCKVFEYLKGLVAVVFQYISVNQLALKMAMTDYDVFMEEIQNKPGLVSITLDFVSWMYS